MQTKLKIKIYKTRNLGLICFSKQKSRDRLKVEKLKNARDNSPHLVFTRTYEYL